MRSYSAGGVTVWDCAPSGQPSYISYIGRHAVIKLPIPPEVLLQIPSFDEARYFMEKHYMLVEPGQSVPSHEARLLIDRVPDMPANPDFWMADDSKIIWQLPFRGAPRFVRYASGKTFGPPPKKE